MSYVDDEMIAAEDGPDLGPPRTREEWDQLFVALDNVETIPTLAVLPDWSELAKAWTPDRIDFGVFDVKSGRCGLSAGHLEAFVAGRPFHPPRDLPSALAEGRLTRADWGTMNAGHPVVVAALQVAEDAERLSRKYGARYRCDECLGAGVLSSTFDWAGALFVHLLTCPHFTDANRDA